MLQWHQHPSNILLVKNLFQKPRTLPIGPNRVVRPLRLHWHQCHGRSSRSATCTSQHEYPLSPTPKQKVYGRDRIVMNGPILGAHGPRSGPRIPGHGYSTPCINRPAWPHGLYTSRVLNYTLPCTKQNAQPRNVKDPTSNPQLPIQSPEPVEVLTVDCGRRVDP